MLNNSIYLDYLDKLAPECYNLETDWAYVEDDPEFEIDVNVPQHINDSKNGKSTSNDGAKADYYDLPNNANTLQDLISYKNMNAQLGEILRATYRYGGDHHSSCIRDMKKIIFYAQAEINRLEKYE